MQIYEEITPQEREAEIRETGYAVMRKAGSSLVLWQAVLCVVLLLAVLTLKYLIPDLYSELRLQYDKEMERSILITYDDVLDS